MNQEINHDFSAYVSPNIFDVLCNSELIAPLLLANLLSPELWKLSEKIYSKYSTISEFDKNEYASSIESLIDEGVPRVIREIQRQLDRDFKHLHPNEIAEIYGYLDIKLDKNRLGSGLLNPIIKDIQQVFNKRICLGGQQSVAMKELLEDIDHERFPAYIYQTYDLVHAHRKFSVHGSRAPNGLTHAYLSESALPAL